MSGGGCWGMQEAVVGIAVCETSDVTIHAYLHFAPLLPKVHWHIT